MTLIVSFNGCYKLIQCHPGNHIRDRTTEEYTEGCPCTRIFEDPHELWEKTVQESFHQVSYPGPFLDQPAIGIVGGPQFGINALWYGAFNELPGTQELCRHLTVPIVILPAI